MDTGTILGFLAGYLAAITGAFLLYLPVIVLVVALLVTAGLLQLLLLPIIILVRRLRHRQEPDVDPSWLLERRR